MDLPYVYIYVQGVQKDIFGIIGSLYERKEPEGGSATFGNVVAVEHFLEGCTREFYRNTDSEIIAWRRKESS